MNEYAEPGELQNLGRRKPVIRKRFGIWSCVTKWPFVCGCGYTPNDAYDEWARISGGSVSHAAQTTPNVQNGLRLTVYAR